MATEDDTRANLIDPKLKAAGWDDTSGASVRRNHKITDGRILGKGARGKAKFADYALVFNNRIVGIVEAKKESLPGTMVGFQNS